MINGETFFDQLDKSYYHLSSSHVKLADYIRQNYKTAVFLNCVSMAREVGTSEATVVRFANALGYSGFTEMINHLQDYIKNEITTLDKLTVAQKSDIYSNVFREVIEKNVRLISSLPKIAPQEKIDQILLDIENCQRLYLVGYESAAGLMEYFGYHLMRFDFKAEVITEKTPNLLNLINAADKETFAISLAFPRYARDQLRVNQALKARGAKICAITDNPRSPMLAHSDYSVFFPRRGNYMHNAGTDTAVFTMFQILIYRHAFKNYEKTRRGLERIEDYNRLFEIF